MKRRQFINQFTLASGGCLLGLRQPVLSVFAHSAESWKRWGVTSIDFLDVAAFPVGKRIPLGWEAFPVWASPHDEARSVLHFPAFRPSTESAWLRITAAIDFREEKKLAAFLPKTGTELGVFDIRFAHPFQPFQIPIDPEHFREIRKQGIGLKMIQGTKDAWFFLPDANQPDTQGLRPQLLISGEFDPAVSFRQNLLSLNSFSPFGWMGGSVQDALLEMYLRGDLAALPVLKQQLDNYLDEEKGIRFENPHTEPLDGAFNSIEDFLPFAAIAQCYPDHPSVQLAVDFLKGKEREDLLIASGNHVTTEGCYTVAYPLAVIAVQRGDRAMAHTALMQLVHRMRFLSDETAIYQRSGLDGQKGYRNWGRGAVWYLLGMIKTLAVLKKSPFEDMPEITVLEKEFQRAIAVLLPWQNQQGLWYSFLDRPDTGVDTSASAGIAAAIGWACEMGVLDRAYLQNALHAYEGLLPYLTPDGFLTAVSQINRGGEALQSGGYRVISQFGMGLLAQLALFVAK